MIKILFVAHSADFCGAEKSLYDLINNIDKGRYQITVCCPFFGNQIFADKVKKIKGVSLFQLPYIHALIKNRNILKMLVNLFYQLRGIFIIFRLIKREKIDLVYSNTVTICVGGVAAKFAAIPHIWSLRESIKSGNLGYFPFGNRIYQRLINAFSDIIIFNSKWTKSEYAEDLRNKSLVVYNGFDLSLSAHQGYTKQKSHSLQNGTVNLGIVGSIISYKGQLEVIQALELLSKTDYKFKLLIYGNFADLGYKKKIEEAISTLGMGSGVEFKGFVYNLDGIYLNIDILLVPSKMDSFGRVIIEGLYYGCAVIASSVGGIPEIIENGYNGILLSQADPRNIADAVLSFIMDTDSFHKMRENAWRTVEKFSLERNVAAVEKIVDGLCLDRMKK